MGTEGALARVRRRLKGPAARARGRAPVVSVVVVGRGPGTDLTPVLDSLRAGDQPAMELLEAADPADLRSSLAAAAGTYLTFAEPGFRAQPSAYSAMVRSLEASGSAVAVARERWVGAGAAPPSWSRPVPPGSLADLSLTNKLIRLDWWRSAGPTLTDWSRAPVAAMDVLTGAPGVDVVDAVVAELRHDDADRPVAEQHRFSVPAAAARAGAWREAARLVDVRRPESYDGWRVAVLGSVLPSWYVDAVGGGPAYLDAVRPLVDDLLTDLPLDQLQQLPVESRLAGLAAVRGTFDELGEALDFLADHPNGLPNAGGHVLLPAGLLDVVGEARRLEPVDSRLHSRVRRPLAQERELFVDAFVEYEPSAPPELALRLRSGELLTAVGEVRPDPATNVWAARAYEDRADASYVVPLPVPAEELTQVRVSLAGQVEEHAVRLRPPGATPVRLDAIVLTGGTDAEVRGSFRGRPPAALVLSGDRGEVSATSIQVEPPRFTAVLPLEVEQFGVTAALPGGHYGLRLVDADGRDLEAAWDPAILGRTPDLLTPRLRLLPAQREAAGLIVDAPLGARDRSAYGQQLLVDRYRSRSARSRPGTVLLETFGGRSTGDNPGAVGRALRAADPELDLVYVVDDPSVSVPSDARAVHRRTPEWFELLAEAGALVTNAAGPTYFAKKPGQLHVQTWHGTPLKRIGEDRGPGDFGVWRHRRTVAAQAAGWDAMVSSGRYTSEIYRSAFGYDGQVLEVGYPRNDVLLAANADELGLRVRQRLGLAEDARVVLYAPTWREYLGKRDAKPLYLDSEALVRQVPGTVVLVRGHYNAFRQRDRFLRNRQVLDVTRYPDIADLFLAADVLVTDYSSVMFDFALTDRPMVLLTPDLEQYRDVERGFYFDFEAEAPGPLVRSTDEVVRVLQEPDTFAPVRDRFRREFCPNEDGTASVRVANYVLENLRR